MKGLLRVLDVALLLAALAAVCWGAFLLTLGLGVTW